MDINDISINALVRDSGLCSDFGWLNGDTFACQWLGLSLEVNQSERDIVVRDPETATVLTFRHVWPRQFDAFRENLHWNFEEEKEAA